MALRPGVDNGEEGLDYQRDSERCAEPGGRRLAWRQIEVASNQHMAGGGNRLCEDDRLTRRLSQSGGLLLLVAGSIEGRTALIGVHGAGVFLHSAAGMRAIRRTAGQQRGGQKGQRKEQGHMAAQLHNNRKVSNGKNMVAI